LDFEPYTTRKTTFIGGQNPPQIVQSRKKMYIYWLPKFANKSLVGKFIGGLNRQKKRTKFLAA
jgi:hypothetical protein